MFNEAFWFFYLVGVVQDLPLTLFFVGFGFAAAAALCLGPGYCACPESERLMWAKRGKKCVTVALILWFVGMFVPSEDAFYAGGAQYVTEATELDETLLNLKGILDQKIEELGVTEGRENRGEDN